MVRDAQVARYLETQVQLLHMRWQLVDGTRSLEATVRQITEHYTESHLDD